MRIGILSDTHDQVARTKGAVAQLLAQGSQVLIHCGDITIPEVVHEFAPLPSYFVFGNCDAETDRLRDAISLVGGTCLEKGGVISLGDKRIAVTHGDSDRERSRLEALCPDYMLTGHTHDREDVTRGRIRYINPGALHRATTWTVALLDIATNHLRVLTVNNASLRT